MTTAAPLTAAAAGVAVALLAFPLVTGPAAYPSFWTVPAATILLASALAYAVGGGPGAVRIGRAMVRRILLTFVSYRFQLVSVALYVLITAALVWVVGGAYARLLFAPLGAVAAAASTPNLVLFLVVAFAAWPIFWKSWEVTAMSVREEQWQGTFESMVALPRGAASLPLAYLTSRLGYTLAFQLVVLAALTTALPTTSIHLRNPGLLLNFAAVLLLAILCMWGMGLLFGGLAVLYKQIGPVDSVIRTLFLFLAGVFVPLDVVPTWMQPLSRMLPLTYAFELLRAIVIEGAPVVTRLDALITLAAFTVAFVVAGNAVYRRYVDTARRQGAIQGY